MNKFITDFRYSGEQYDSVTSQYYLKAGMGATEAYQKAHHRGQKPVENGGILDDLEEYTHRRGGNHTRHTEPSELTSTQRAKEIREYWKKRGSEYILSGEAI